MTSKVLVRKYMTLAEFVAYLTNGRLPMDGIFEKQFDLAHPFDTHDSEKAQARARCVLELGLVRATGYRCTRVPFLSLPFLWAVTSVGFLAKLLFKSQIEQIVKEKPLSADTLALALMGTSAAFKMAKPSYKITEYRHLKRKYSPERKLYIDFMTEDEAAKEKWVIKDSYLPLQMPDYVMDKILKYAAEDKGVVDGRIGITPDLNQKIGYYRFDLSKNRVFITYKNPLFKNNFFMKALSPLYRRFSGWEDLQISTKDALDRFPSENRPEFECAYEWEEKAYSENDLSSGEYNPQDASLYYTLCRDIYRDFDLEHRAEEYSAAALREEILKRAPDIPEKRIESLLGVLPHKAKGGRPKGK